MKQLRSLNLWHAKGFSGRGLARLRPMAHLRFLDLSHSSVTDDGLIGLAALKQLDGLGLRGTNITGAGLAHLTALQKMTTLCLYASKVTDDGLVGIKEMIQLQRLDLYDTGITDGGLGASLLPGGAHRLILLLQPAQTNAKAQPPTGYPVDRRCRLRDVQRMAKGQDEHADTEADALRARGDGGEDGERVHDWGVRVDSDVTPSAP